MVGRYEEMVESLGRQVFIRPKRRRFRRDSLLGTPRLQVDGQKANLYDVSMNGVSILTAPEPENWPNGRRLPLQLEVNGEIVYDGEGEVVRTAPFSFGRFLHVGMRLVRGFIPLEDIEWRLAETGLNRKLAMGPEIFDKLVPRRYRIRTEATVHFLRHYKTVLDRHEARLLQDTVKGQERRETLRQQVYDDILPNWQGMLSFDDELTAEVMSDMTVLRATKAYTESLLTPLLMHCDNWRRCFVKPLGYPGDYKIMLMFYEDGWGTGSLYSQIFHKLGNQQLLARGVVERMRIMVDLMSKDQREHVATRGADTPFRALNIGCGPAIEAGDFVRQNQGWPGKIVWTLLDQEHEVLSLAYAGLQEALHDTRANGEVQCLNMAFSQLIAAGEGLVLKQRQHLIYSLGLFDYIRLQRAQGMLAAFYQQLEPGGMLAICNAKAPNPAALPTTTFLDWHLIYRTESDMIDMAALLPQDADCRVVPEPTHAYHFLLVRKPNAS